MTVCFLFFRIFVARWDLGGFLYGSCFLCAFGHMEELLTLRQGNWGCQGKMVPFAQKRYKQPLTVFL